MKKLEIIFLMAILISLALACSKSDTAPSPSIVGSWLSTTTVRTGCSSSASNGTTNCPSNCTITITATTITGFGTTATYTIAGNSITTLSNGVSRTATFVVTTTTLIVTSQNSVADGGCQSVVTYTRL